MKTRILILDYETYSECELKMAGADEYARHPSTEILCAAFRLGTVSELQKAPTHLWFPGEPSPHFGTLLRALLDPDVKLVAHNAFFEQVITRYVFAQLMNSKPGLKEIPLERWHCTAAMARSAGLPGSLEGAGAALALPVQKDKEGHRLMLTLSKPNRNGERDKDPEKLKRLGDYCRTDVTAETLLYLKLPPLLPKERQFWLLDQKMNHLGFRVDRPLVQGALHLVNREILKLNREATELSKGKLNSTRQNAKLLKIVKRLGVPLPNLQAGTIRDVLAKGVADPVAKRLLEIRAMCSKSSTSKYAAMEMRSRFDGRCRDTSVFYGAHTGRQAGRGLQPQNLFKSTIKLADLLPALDLIRNRDQHTIDALFNPMELYASAIRSCIIAEEGFTLDVGDLSRIELIILFWVAGHKDGLAALEKDIYCQMAGYIYDRDPDKLQKRYEAGDEKARKMRDVGKQTILGAGFGMGLDGKKFVLTVKKYGMVVDFELAKRAIRAYRKLHVPVPAFWRKVEHAAKLALQNPGKRYRLGQVVWSFEAPFLKCYLPSGRAIHYFNAKLVKKVGLYGESTEIQYLAMRGKANQFGRVQTWGGKLTENLVQAIARDVFKEALLRISEEKDLGFPVIEVHDEICNERNLKKGSLKKFLSLMEQRPEWGKDIPVKANAWSETRYRK